MAPAAPAYRYPERETQRDPRVRVVPGRGVPVVSDPLPGSVLLVARIFAVFVIVFALLGFAKIGLASAAVTTAVAAEEISAQIESARSAGSELEVRESYLTSPTYLKAEATKLDMGEAAQTDTIVMPHDVVITDEQGDLSLSRSLQAVSQG